MRFTKLSSNAFRETTPLCYFSSKALLKIEMSVIDIKEEITFFVPSTLSNH